MRTPTALITGISGQDGSYLGETLLAKGYEVHGLVRKGNLGLARHLEGRIAAHSGDINSSEDVTRIVREVAPDEIYHLASQTRPGASWDDPIGTFDVSALGTVRLLEAALRGAPDVKVFVAGSAEMYGSPAEAPQDERTPFTPRNPYGAAKAAAMSAARAYRAGRDLFVSVGVLFNHESPRRPVDFVSRKVTWHAAAIVRGRARELRLGNLDAQRDWGYAPDYVEGAWLALQAQQPDDYVFATGELHSVRELVDIAFARAGIEAAGRVIEDERLFRPEPPTPLVGNPDKAKRELGWKATISFEAMVAEMVDRDLEALR